MALDKEYSYSFISEFRFNSKLLGCNNDGSVYRKFLMVNYKVKNKTKTVKIFDYKDLKKINNIINFYVIEEIVSTCIYFDSEFKELIYYHFDDLYFIKYKLYDDNIKINGLFDDADKVYSSLKEKLK